MKNQALADYLFLENFQKRNYSDTHCTVGDELFNKMKSIVDKYMVEGSRKEHHMFRSTTVCKVLIPFPWDKNMHVSYDISYCNHKNIKDKMRFDFDGTISIKRSVSQPNFLKVKNTHFIKYKGFEVEIRLNNLQNPEICIYYSKEFRSAATWNVSSNSLKEELNTRIGKYLEAQEFRKLRDDFRNGNLNDFLKSEYFAYARIKKEFDENVALIYIRNSNSPTGVELLKTVKEQEWESAAKATNNSHNYLVGSEKW